MTNSDRDWHDRCFRLYPEHEEPLRTFVSSLLFADPVELVFANRPEISTR